MKKELLTKDDGRYIVFYSATPAEEKSGEETESVAAAGQAGGQAMLREWDEKAGEG